VATYCLVHGAWHDSSCWESVGRFLEARDHDVVAPDLPLHDPTTGFEQRVRPALDEIEDATDPVVVVGHSMGSAYATLVAATRPESLLVHLCPRLGGLAVPSGAPETFREGFPFPPDRPDGTSVWDEHAAIDALYGRLSPETARAMARRLRPMAPPVDEYPLGSHPSIPTVLVYAADDELFQPEWERFMAREVLAIAPIEIPGGHFPMAEDPGRLAELLDRLGAEHTDSSARA
jgi:pimeloyl-ACP methyl ester carboxylesterase